MTSVIITNKIRETKSYPVFAEFSTNPFSEGSQEHTQKTRKEAESQNKKEKKKKLQSQMNGKLYIFICPDI